MSAPVEVAEEVTLLRVPNDGIQPQAAVDEQGTIHLVYYKGDSSTGNLFYVTRPPEGTEWSSPVQVNSQDASADRNEPISRAQMAVGEDGIVHVVWFNMNPAKYWYTRKESNTLGFEKQRNLVSRYNVGVETGASVAVDDKGGVFVTWHAGDFTHEDKRAVYMVRSSDAGQTFTSEERVNPNDTGVCACCGLKSMVDNEGSIYISYRSAGDKIHRDMTLLKSTDEAQTFLSETVDKWQINACPVSTTALADGPSGPVVAWETKGQIYFAHASELTELVSAPGKRETRRKNPAVAINQEGKILLAWAEGSGFKSGGQLHWQVYDADRKIAGSEGHLTESLPDYSIPEVVARNDGSFVILY